MKFSTPKAARFLTLLPWLLTAALLLAATANPSWAQTISTAAGGGIHDNGPATQAFLLTSTASSAAADAAGNLYIADSGNQRVRKVDAATGIISTVAGNGTTGFSGDGGPATSAQLSGPVAVAVDASGNLYIADNGNQRIRKVTAATGRISTVAGTGVAAFTGNGGPATSATFRNPSGVAVDAAGNLYIADTSNQSIRRVDAATGIISQVAGTGVAAFSGDGGLATSANLNNPFRVALDNSGNLYIADSSNHRIRKVTAATGIISTVAGDGTTGGAAPFGDGGPATSAQLSSPDGVVVDGSGNLYIADSNHARIRRVDALTGIISLAAGGGGNSTANNIPATSARFSNFITGLAVDGSGNLYIVDNNQLRVCKVTAATGIITVVAGVGSGSAAADQIPATESFLAVGCPAVAADASGNLYIADSGNSRVRKVDAQTGVITTLAGDGAFAFSGDGGPATSARLNAVQGVAVDKAGNVYIADTNNRRVRKVAPNGIISTVAGTGTAGYSGDGGLATSAQLAAPAHLATDAAGNLYIADPGAACIRRVDVATGLISTVAGNGTAGFSGDNGPATSAQLKSPFGVSFDAGGNLYIADRDNQRIRRVDAQTRIITTVAGNGTTGAGGDLGGAINAQFNSPQQVAFDAFGNLYVDDLGNHRIRRINANDQVISTVAGSGIGFAGDGGPAASALLSAPRGIAFDGAGNLYIAENYRVRKVAGLPQQSLGAQGAAANVSPAEFAGYTLVYNLPVPNSLSTGAAGVPPYTVNQAGTIAAGSFDRIAYYLELNSGSGPRYVWVSMDAFTTNPARIGVPTVASGAFFQTKVNNMNVESNAAGVVTGKGISTGNIEFWPYDYSQAITLAGIGGNGSIYDFNDHSIGSATYGSMQVHNYGAGQTLFSYNRWGGTSGTSDLGIGNSPSGHPDWTFQQNAGTYTTKLLQVYVRSTRPTTTAFLSPANQPWGTCTLSAAVSAASGTPTGSVTFSQGGTVLGTAPLSNGVATLAAAFATPGTFPITATFGANGSFAGSSDSQSLTVTAHPVALTVQGTGGTFGSGSVGYTAGLSDLLLGTPVSGARVGFTASDPAALPAATATTDLAGVATAQVVPAAAGTFTVAAHFAGSPHYLAATSPASAPFVVAKAAQTLSFAALAGKTFGEAPVVLNATATSGLPVGFAVSGPATLAGNELTLTGAGLVTVTASQAGDPNYLPAEAVAQSFTVSPAVTASTLDAAPNPAVYGQPVQLTATVSAVVAGAGIPTGSVIFRNGAVDLATVPVDAQGQASIGIGLEVGSYTLSVEYVGEGNFAGSTSAALSQTVAPAPTTTSLTADLNPAEYGQVVTFTATVSQVGQEGFGLKSSGSLTFMDGETVLGTGTPQLSKAGNVFVFSIAGLAVGEHQITAVFSGDANHLGSSSEALGQTINPAATVSALSSLLNPSEYGQEVSFVASVSTAPAAPVKALPPSKDKKPAPAPLVSIPSGSVTFIEGETVLGSVDLDGKGNAWFSTAALGAGDHLISAVYAGDATHAGSTSDAFTQTVNPAAQTIAFAPLADQVYGSAPVALNATATSGLPVSYTLTGPATLSGNTLILTGAGVVTVTAAQAGDANYLPAAEVTQSLVVTKATATLSLAGLSATYDGSPKPVGVTSSPADLDGVNVTYEGNPTAPVNAGSYAVVATLNNANYQLVEPVAGTLVIARASQGIAFAPLADRNAGDAPFVLSATASSGLPVSFSLTGPATISGNTVTLTGAGTVVVTASQAGDNNHLPATAVVQSFAVLDRTPPTVTAALTPISRDRDEDEDEDGNFYRITATAVDLVDAHPVVTALITQPLTPSSSMVVSYKREKKNRIQIKAEKKKLQVQLEGPSESALRALWSQVLAAGGFSVSDGQQVQLVVKKDKKDEYEAQYQFNTGLQLTAANAPGLSLVVSARDAAGNQSPQVQVFPKRSGSAKMVSAGSLPTGFGLESNYPNPFNPSTTLRYNLAEAGQVQLTVYNVMGQQVRVLVDQVQQAGAYQVEWDATDALGQRVAPGLYLYRLVAGDQAATGKMLLLK